MARRTPHSLQSSAQSGPRPAADPASPTPATPAAEVPVLQRPAGGVPDVVDTPSGFRRAARVLARGAGPFAIDTERASGFRFDDRAFLIQIKRRGAGTFLLAPEGYRTELNAALAPVINGQDWVIHAAASDLPSLSWLGLHPGTLFDTELAGRIAGYPRVNLAAMTEAVLGVRLEKGHGAEDWSTTPLPRSWLAYAALDVELLLELAEALAEVLDEQGKLDWASQEFASLVERHRDDVPPLRHWRNTRGVSTVVSTRTLAIVRELWQAREAIAVYQDLSPSVLLPDKMILAIAHAAPRTPREMHGIPGMRERYRRHSSVWLQAVKKGKRVPADRLPRKAPKVRSLPAVSAWPRRNRTGARVLAAAQQALEEFSRSRGIPVENIIKPAVLRAAIWAATYDKARTIADVAELIAFLDDHDVRAWQRDIAVSLVAPLLFASAAR
ncbi:HRDC domain-containing protein [Corynebacterium uberis]|uniref:HRDC domain-containing protein n=1 Tax=Corynebacterium TaxID=1716 RepID=UPI001D0BA785|nr:MULTISPECIES: HRDC domain-containing protein [Corynebacterium]MCZ9308525.1 HRDC domain-containing protein [Corynebacterium sp. c6VSa_13]UDL74177.1 HRDC domain-containing protein [Corynebacterium uberis]UDL74939.1 HRDC domain-containing protein [Corynebacterium uberis]UDL77154.1 HRDC domain-containing protein [Corynebacterium uberis]UDL79436.1 HRDC domain-containing protein [Corynebacterium uberis]